METTTQFENVPKVAVVIVTWNSMRYLFDSFESLVHQSYRDFSVIVIDNGSDDGTVEFIRTHYPTVFVLQNFKNLGFAKAYNQGIKLSKSPYILAMNDDVVLTEDFLSEIVYFAQNKPQGGSFGGKLLKLYTSEMNPAEKEGGQKELVKSDKIDAAGLKIFKTRRVINRGEYQTDKGQFDRAEEVFGLSGACTLFSREALNDVVIRKEYFDEDFFAYKEDIDLAWRMRLYGWQNWYVPTAVAYHHRRLGGSKKSSSVGIASHHKKLPKVLRYYSFKNHHLMLVKNSIPKNLFVHSLYILWYELKMFGYALILEPFQIKSIIKFFKQLPKTLIKRRVIMGHRKVSAKDIRKWFR
ncbi:glycosyltransferase family 2 protein [Patescibacteria group bacterium]|nr:glycosyltransferase family 2 protein [Patescibacteria group bacterium]